jgi:hypothetical protein
MEFHQNPSSFSSLQQLLEELENFLALESSKIGNPWMSVTKLSKLFSEKYGISLEEAVKVQDYSGSLRSLFTVNGRFSIYGTSIPQEFYVALLQEVVPDFYLSQTSSIKYRIKRPWKVDGRLLRMLRAEGTEELPSQQISKISEHQSILVSEINQPASVSEINQPILLPEIKSINDLEIALIEIIKSLMENHPKKAGTIVLLSRKFHNLYGQPIRTVIRNVCSDMRLIDLLQTIPNLQVQEVENDWQITLEIHSAE